MPRFPRVEQLGLPCRFERFVPGQEHSDGRRYLPLVLLRLANGLLLGVTDRHHLVDEQLVGREGTAQLVLLLSAIQLQQGTQRREVVAEPELGLGRATTAPEVFGQVIEVISWELQQKELPFEALFTELLLDIGIGIVGVRTNLTAPKIADTLGSDQIQPGDWLQVWRSRIDVLGFYPKT